MTGRSSEKQYASGWKKLWNSAFHGCGNGRRSEAGGVRVTTGSEAIPVTYSEAEGVRDLFDLGFCDEHEFDSRSRSK